MKLYYYHEIMMLDFSLQIPKMYNHQGKCAHIGDISMLMSAIASFSDPFAIIACNIIF